MSISVYTVSMYCNEAVKSRLRSYSRWKQEYAPNVLKMIHGAGAWFIKDLTTQPDHVMAIVIRENNV